MSEPVWITADQVLAIHSIALERYGGQSGVRDMSALESALARPVNLLAYSPDPPSLPRLAAAYAFGIARNHPFLDGNKRTALVVCYTFLRKNGINVSASEPEEYPLFIELAAGRVSEAELAAWLEAHSAPIK